MRLDAFPRRQLRDFTLFLVDGLLQIIHVEHHFFRGVLYFFLNNGLTFIFFCVLEKREKKIAQSV
jgi:hypothetical protein